MEKRCKHCNGELKTLEFDKDFPLERAKEMGLFQLRLNLQKGLIVTGFDFDNRILIRKVNSQEGGN